MACWRRSQHFLLKWPPRWEESRRWPWPCCMSGGDTALAVPHQAPQLGSARQVVPHRRWSAGCIPSSMTSRRTACGITVTKGRRSSALFGQFRSFQMSGSSELKTLAALGLVFVDRVVTPGLSKLDVVVSEVCLGSKMILRWSYRNNNVASSGRSFSPEW